jgi:hypothetical protein
VKRISTGVGGLVLLACCVAAALILPGWYAGNVAHGSALSVAERLRAENGLPQAQGWR